MTGSNIQAPAYQREVTVLAQSAATLALTHLGHGLDQSSAYITTACTCQSCDVVSCGMPAARYRRSNIDWIPRRTGRTRWVQDLR